MDKPATAATLLEALAWLGPLIGTGGVTAIVLALIGMRRPADRPGAEATPQAPQTRYYFDGPLIKALDTLEGIYREIKELRQEFGKAEQSARERHKEHCDIMRDVERAMWRRHPD